MTEAEWLATGNFSTLHHILWHVAPERPRKYRLVGCGFCRLILSHITDERLRTIIDFAERYADDSEMQPQLVAAFRDAEQQGVFKSHGTGSDLYVAREACAPDYVHKEYCSNQLDRSVADAQDMLMGQTYTSENDDDNWDACFDVISRRIDGVIVPLIRDVFGNPFRPVVVAPEWLTPDVLAIAAGIYSERAFDRMPILADALQDAGCDSSDILNHCRQPGEHVRGCWVVDLILGKS